MEDRRKRVQLQELWLYVPRENGKLTSEAKVRTVCPKPSIPSAATIEDADEVGERPEKEDSHDEMDYSEAEI